MKNFLIPAIATLAALLFTLSSCSKDSSFSSSKNVEVSNPFDFVGELVGADLGGAIAGIWSHRCEIVISGAIGGVGCGLAAAGRAAFLPALVASAGEGLVIGCGMMF